MHMNLREICAASSAGRFQLVLASRDLFVVFGEIQIGANYKRLATSETVFTALKVAGPKCRVIYIIWSEDQHRIRNPRVDVQS